MAVSVDIIQKSIVGIDFDGLTKSMVQSDGTLNTTDTDLLKVYDRITTYADLAQSAILALTHASTLPDALEFIVVELTLEKFNKAHNEGETSTSESNVSITFDSNSLSKYYGIISQYIDSSQSNGKAVSW